MREIGFRVWHKGLREMFVVGHIRFGIDEITKVETGSLFSVDWLLEDIELMQFTGFKDRHGHEIYEGDILSCFYDRPITMRDEHVWPHEEFRVLPEDRKQEVYWESGSFKLFDHGKHDWMLLGVSDPTKMAIIGNIYENPDMVPPEKVRRHLKVLW